MKIEFEMSMMGELKFFLGLQINQTKDGIYIHQEKYTKELLKKYNLNEGKPKNTPSASTLSLEFDENGEDVNEKLNKGMIGSVLYLTTSRPNIVFSTCLCACFQATTKISHLKAVKHIFRYLKGTSNLRLFYPIKERLELVAYSDVDYAGSKIDRKSTNGTCHFLGESLISWSSKKQASIALSTYESEYIVASLAFSQVIYINQFLRDLNITLKKIKILCDNTSAINLSKNPIHYSRSKHIDVSHQFLRDNMLKGNIELNFVPTNEKLSDIFTKPLKTNDFIRIRRRLGIC